MIPRIGNPCPKIARHICETDGGDRWRITLPLIRPTSLVANYVTEGLTSVSVWVTQQTSPCEGVVRPEGRAIGRERCPRAALQPAPGRLGHQPAGTRTGTRGASLQPGATPAGASRRILAPPPGKPGPTLSLRDEQSHWREPWWNADTRARCASARAAPEARADGNVRSRGAVSPLPLRVSAFRFLLFALPG